MNTYKRRILLYVIGFLLSGFIILTLLVYIMPDSVIDWEFSEEVQEYQHPFLDTMMKWVSIVGNSPVSIIVVLITSLIFLIFRYKREALFICLTLLSGIVSSVLKIIIDRPRPTKDVVRIISDTSRQSFPSGHVLFYVVFFGFIVLLMYRLKTLPSPLRIIVSLISLVLIFSVPFSRIYLGAHWFTDVLGGFLMGLLCLLTLGYFYLQKGKKDSL